VLVLVIVLDTLFDYEHEQEHELKIDGTGKSDMIATCDGKT
jgi:hypothetical protein